MGRLIPFWMLPAFWGLTGADRELEYIKYNYSGIEQENKLNYAINKHDKFEFNKLDLDIKLKYDLISDVEYRLKINDLMFQNKKKTKQQYNIDNFTINYEFNLIDEEEYEYGVNEEKYKNKKEGHEYKLAKINLDKKYNHITVKDYDYQVNDIINQPSTYEWQKNKIDLDLQYGSINQQQYDKSLCTIKGEPYFEVINGRFDTPDEDSIGTGGFSFELDYNDIFVQKLKDEGWTGHSDQQIVDEYFKEICKQVGYEEEIFSQENISFGPVIDSVNDGDITRFS